MPFIDRVLVECCSVFRESKTSHKVEQKGKNGLIGWTAIWNGKLMICKISQACKLSAVFDKLRSAAGRSVDDERKYQDCRYPAKF